FASRRFQLAFAHAVRSPLDDGHVGVMGQSVEQSGDGGSVGKDGVPVLEALIGRQHNRMMFVTVVDDFEEQVGGVRVIGQVTDLVDAEQSGASVEAELAAQAGGIAFQISEQVGGGTEEDGVAGENRRVGDVFGQH